MLEDLSEGELAALDGAMHRAQELITAEYGAGLGFITTVGMELDGIDLFSEVTEVRRIVNRSWLARALYDCLERDFAGARARIDPPAAPSPLRLLSGGLALHYTAEESNR